MSQQTRRPVFHLSLPVSDLSRSTAFYESLGGEAGRVGADCRDVWLFGAQITLFEDAAAAARTGELGRLHFGATLPLEAWSALVRTLPAASPVTQKEGELRQHKLYLRDPDGWTIELKSYDNPAAALERPGFPD